MKKLIVAAAAMILAVSAQAVAFKWGSAVAGDAIDVAAIAGYGNGIYAAGGADLMSTSDAAFTYVLTVYAAGTTDVIGTANGDVTFGATGKFQFSSVDVAGTQKSTKYDYTLAITGTQGTINELGKVAAKDAEGTYDYTDAVLAWTTSGSVTTKASGATTLTDTPTTFTVSGVTLEAVPEPTSGLLLLLGMAGLALRRRRA